MSLSTAIVALAALTTPDMCTEARTLAEQIAQARDNGVAVTEILDIVEGDPLWTKTTAIIYMYPNIPPVAFGVMTEKACRG